MTTAIIYLRTSTEEQNPQNQLQDCKELIKDNWKHEVIEEKQSAFKDKDRVVFELIKTRIKSREIEHLIVWDWDRLFRNRKLLKEFFEFCKFHDCKIHSFRQKWFEDFHNIPKPFDEIISELVLNLMGWIAEDESQKKSERVKIAYKNRKGKWGRKPLSDNVIQEVLDCHNKGMDLRSISESVFYWEKHRNKRSVSLGAVHKIIKENAN